MIRRKLTWMAVGAWCLLLWGPAAWADQDGEDEDVALARSREGRREEARREEPRREDSRREEPRQGPPPKVMVLHLKHISAGSFMNVLAQLGRAEGVQEMLRKLPVAANPESNTVIIIGPPEVFELFGRIAAEMDQPSEFHERMRERGMDEQRRQMELKEQATRRGMELRQEMQKRGLPMSPPMLRPREGAPREEPRREAPPMEGMDRLGAVLERGLADPAADLLKRVTDKATIEQLHLVPPQAEKIHAIARGHFEQLGQLRERIKNALKDMDPKDRPREAEEMLKGARGKIEDLARQAREQVSNVLEPPQRQMLERMLRPEGGPAPGRPGEVRERRGMPGGPPGEGESRPGGREL